MSTRTLLLNALSFIELDAVRICLTEGVVVTAGEMPADFSVSSLLSLGLGLEKDFKMSGCSRFGLEILLIALFSLFGGGSD